MFDFIFTIVAPFVSLGTVATICIILCATIAISRYQKLNRVALKNKHKWYQFPLIKKTSITHNTNIYRFGLKPNVCLGLSVGQHISVRAMIQDKTVQRNYTPISLNNQKGYFELMIKTYPNGNVSKYMNEMNLGDLLEVIGPRGRYRYIANQKPHICMIAGGTGITPMLQIINHILSNPKDRTKIHLIFGNLTIQDILLKEELDSLIEKYPKRFLVYYVVDIEPNTGDQWNGGIGFITAEMIKTNFPPPSPDVQILICGPPPMVKSAADACASIGYNPANTISNPKDMIFKF